MHSGILLSCERGNPVTFYSMDKPWGYYVGWSKSEQILYNSTDISGVFKIILTENRMVVVRGLGKRGKGTVQLQSFNFVRWKCSKLNDNVTIISTTEMYT